MSWSSWTKSSSGFVIWGISASCGRSVCPASYPREPVRNRPARQRDCGRRDAGTHRSANGRCEVIWLLVLLLLLLAIGGGVVVSKLLFLILVVALALALFGVFGRSTT